MGVGVLARLLILEGAGPSGFPVCMLETYPVMWWRRS